jgi:phosphoglycolate phosphatase
MRKLILFDIDGTLLRDGGAAERVFDQAFSDLFAVPEASAGIDKHGRTDLEICRDAAHQAEEIQALQERYLHLLPNALAACETFQVLPGVATLCADLARDDRVLLGLQTGNMETAAWAKLRRAKLADYFAFGGFGSDSPDRAALVRTAINRGRTLAPVNAKAIYVVGDAPGDIHAGRRNQVHTVAVGTGLTGLETLRALQPDFLLPDLSDADRFKRLLGLAA